MTEGVTENQRSDGPRTEGTLASPRGATADKKHTARLMENHWQREGLFVEVQAG